MHFPAHSECGRWDLNPHDIAATRTLILLVCQFRHFRSSLYEVIALSLSRRLDYNIKKVVECQPLFSIFLIFLFKRESSGLQPPFFELVLRQRLVVEEALDHVYVHAFQYILLSVPLDAFYHDIQVHGICKLRHRAHESI